MRNATAFMLLVLPLIGCPACQPAGHYLRGNDPSSTSPPSKAAWLAEHHLLPASADEITMAKSSEVRLVNDTALAPNRKVRVTFHPGVLKKNDRGASPGNGYTTTSHYQLLDHRTGKLLARVESKLSKQWQREPGDQKIWFSPDGQTALIFESLTDGDQRTGLYALLRCQPDGSSWTVSYLNPPKSGGLPYRDSDPIPAGLLGDMIILDAWATGEFHKVKISDIPAGAPPLPFTVG